MARCTRKVLELQRRSVEIDPLPVRNNVQSIPPPGLLGAQTHLDNRRRIPSSNHRRQLSGPDFPISVQRQLFEPSLHLQAVVFGVHSDQRELAFAVEGVLQVVEGDHVGIPEDSGQSWGLVGDAVLSGSTLEAESFAAYGLLFLPDAAQVAGNHVVVPVG